MAAREFTARVVRPGMLIALRDEGVAARVLMRAGIAGRCTNFMCRPAEGDWLWRLQGADASHDWYFRLGDGHDETHPLDAFACCDGLHALFQARDADGAGRAALKALCWADWLGLPWAAWDETGESLEPEAVRRAMRDTGVSQDVAAQREGAKRAFRGVSHVVLWTEWGSTGVWAGDEASAVAAGGMIRLCNLPVGPALIRHIAMWHAVFDDHAPERPRPEDEADWIEAEQLALASRLSLELGEAVLVSAGLGPDAPAFRAGRPQPAP